LLKFGSVLDGFPLHPWLEVSPGVCVETRDEEHDVLLDCISKHS
jgi:hypothetical protein